MVAHTSRRTQRPSYWGRTLLLTSVMLGLWVVITAAVGLWTPDLRFSFFGWPFGFWAAAQGALVLYCAIVWAYAFLMERLEQDYDGHVRD